MKSLTISRIIFKRNVLNILRITNKAFVLFFFRNLIIDVFYLF
jgi:hypothetical protein